MGKRKIRMGGFFTGIGAHHSAAMRVMGRRDDVEFEVVFQCEFDPVTASAYDTIHGETRNLGDITRVKDIGGDLAVDWLVATPPCQDISIAGRQKGLGEGTRSGLIYEIPRILGATEERERPRIIVWEDVPMLAQKYKPEWEDILGMMSELGYSTRYAILNAADYGVAQSRRRLYAVSRLHGNPPRMPEPFPLEKRLKDYLEPEPVAPEYYLSEERIKGLVWSNQKEKEASRGYRFEPTDGEVVAHTVTSRGGGRKTDNFLLLKGKW